MPSGERSDHAVAVMICGAVSMMNNAVACVLMIRKKRYDKKVVYTPPPTHPHLHSVATASMMSNAVARMLIIKKCCMTKKNLKIKTALCAHLHNVAEPLVCSPVQRRTPGDLARVNICAGGYQVPGHVRVATPHGLVERSLAGPSEARGRRAVRCVCCGYGV